MSSRGLHGLGLGLGLGLSLSLSACDGPRPQAHSCPPCEAAANTPAQPCAHSAAPENTLDIIAAANRKMMHDDGAGCLAELGQLPPRMMPHFVMIQAQCEMLIGECQAGKQKVADFYVHELAMSQLFADKTAENLASLRCKGGDASERDRLNIAYQDLQDAAYMNARDVEYCTERVEIIEALAPKVSPRDAQDTIQSGRQALFHTSAMCLARAGDCAAALASYTRLFPAQEPGSEISPAQREAIVQRNFASTIALCADASDQ